MCVYKRDFTGKERKYNHKQDHIKNEVTMGSQWELTC